MADDIDIEEHDVLESLRRRQLPDAVVKQEPLDEDYTEPHYEPDSEYSQSRWPWESDGIEPAQVKVEKPDEMDIDIPFGKIILGSKPPDFREVIHPPEARTEEKDDEGDTQEDYNYNMSLVLEDWGPILEASNCYCPDCETLFATVNALDAHKMIAHSFLIAMDKEPSPERNKAVKSTAKFNDLGATCEICKTTFKGQSARSNLLRHYRNVHQVDAMNLKSENELKNWKVCNHCNVYFPSDTALVKHLYELLPLNDSKAKDDKPSPVKVQSAVKTPNDSKVTPKIVRTERKPVKLDQVPTVSNVDTTPVPKPIVVKTVKQTPKQANSLILGSKVNGVRVDVTENEGITNSTLRKCEVCGVEYSRKYYIIHMRKFHSEILQAKLNRLKKMQPVINVSTNVRYKCSVCHLMFESSSSARKHRAQKHPEMKGKRMLLKIVKTSKIQKVKVKPKALSKPKKSTPSEENVLVVSKSTLFKCNRCSVHFLTCYGACAHSRVCETTSNHRDWSCPQCQKVFKIVDKKAHEFQHQTVNAKFKVYVVYLEMVVRILCECPYCYVCFEEYKFWRHIKFGCERDTESFFCNECRLPIDTSSKTNHDSKHTQGDFTKEDFIRVDFISSNKEVKVKAEPKEKDIPVPALKTKLKPSDGAATKGKRQLREEMNLFYCPSCKRYLSRKLKDHVTGECKKNKSSKLKVSCKSCGICFTSHSRSFHLRLHRKYPNLTLHDLTFTRITDDKKMKPIPEYYPCNKCHVNFLAKVTRFSHDCSTIKSFNCQVCQKKIDKTSFKIHMRFHSYAIPGKVKTAQKTLQSTAKPLPFHRGSEVRSPTKLKRNEPSALAATELPELLMKYQSLTTLWNILYVCETCDTFTDSYDKVVEHCQNHFTNMESYGVVIMKCQICNMKFDRECYRRHLELHAGGTNINRNSFKILRYDHAKLFSAEWLNFIDLPEDQKSQILSRSMYGQSSYVRMRLEQQGPPEYTLYKCKLCQKCISPEAIIHHMTLMNCLKANKIICPLCSMVFVNRTTFCQHEKLHETTHLDADSFRIVAFNDSNDADLNKKILSEYNAGEVVVTEDAPKTPDFFAKYPDNVKLVKGNKFYMFYKCADCEICTLDVASSVHICSAAKKVCPKCGLTVALNSYNEHAKLHEEIMFSDKNVFTRSFFGRPAAGEANNKDTSKNVAAVIEKKNEAQLYKCHCGLHFTSLKTIEKHYQSKNCGSVVREKCSHCYLVFDPNEIVNHLCKHHAQTQFQRFNVVTPNKRTLFKCKHCHVLFYDKRIGVVHSEKCDGVSNGTKCDACGLAFDRLSIKAHKDEHKVSGKAKLDCYIVENITNDSNIDNNVLYKCKKCNVHYIEPASARNHVGKYNHQMHQVKKCDQCSLRFTVKTLPRHVELHHNLLKIDRFRIKCIPFANTTDSGDKPSVSKAEVIKEPTAKETTDEDSIILKAGEAYKIYRCKKCKLHFTDGETLLNHNEDRCSKELVEECEFCSLKFSAKNIKKHYKQHNGVETIKMEVTEENDAIKQDVEINEGDDKDDTVTEGGEESREYADLNLYRCTNCAYHFNLKETCIKHIRNYCEKIKSRPVKCDECNVSFTKIGVMRHIRLHDKYNLKKGDFNIIDVTDPRKDGAADNDGGDQNDTVTEGGDDLNLYRCTTCRYHFNLKDSWLKHVRSGCENIKGPPVKCDECNLLFTKHSLMHHKTLHDKYNLKKDDFNIIDVIDPTKDGAPDNDDGDKNDTATKDGEESCDNADFNLYRCKSCIYHFNSKRSCQRHIDNGCKKTKRLPVKCDECGLTFSKKSIVGHKLLHIKYNLKKDDFNITYVSDPTKDGAADNDNIYGSNSEDVDVNPLGFADDNSQSTNDNGTVASLDSNLETTRQEPDVSTIDTNSTVEAETSQQSDVNQMKTKAKARFYKCGDCNVHFVGQNTCYKHVTKHTPLNPRDYIECKLCGFQFIIAALQAHIRKHHAEEFRLEDIVVEEYHPNVLKNNLPDIEIYCAIEKEQSSLVSSSDINNEAQASETAQDIENENSKSEIVDVDSTEVDTNSNGFSEKVCVLDET